MATHIETRADEATQFSSLEQAVDAVEVMRRTRNLDLGHYQNLQNALEVLVFDGLTTTDAKQFQATAHQLIEFLVSPATIDELRGTPHHDVYLHIMDCLAQTASELFPNIQIYPDTQELVDRQDHSLHLLNILLDRHDHPLLKQNILAFYEESLTCLVQGLLTTGYEHSEALAHLIHAKPELLPQVIDLLGTTYYTLPPQVRNPKWFGFFPFSGRLDSLAQKITLLTLGWFGLTEKEAEKLLTDWERDTARGREFHPADIRFTLRSMSVIEMAHPGAVSELYHQFGLRAFGRYPLRMLEETYEGLTRSADPWILVISPASDHSGYFERDISLFNSLLDELDEIRSQTGTRYRTQIIEYETPAELVKRLRIVHEHFDPAVFIIWGSHGQRESLNAGFSYETKITRGDLLPSGRIGRALKKYVRPETQIVLQACSTGREGGFAQTLSRLGFKVLAPDQNSGLIKIQPISSENRLTAQAYYRDATTMVYKDGFLVDSYNFD